MTLISCHIFSREFLPFTAHKHTHTIITILLSPAPPFPSLFDSPLQSCLPVSKVPWCWRLGYPPLGHSTTASRRRAPRLGLPPFFTVQQWQLPLLQPGLPTSISCTRSSGSKQRNASCLSCPPPPQPRLTLFLLSQLAGDM